MSKNPFSDDFQQQPYQPPGTGGSQVLPPGTVKNYLVESILLLLCCGGIFAIPAIVYAAQVNGLLSAGNHAGALKASQNAKTWCLVALLIGIVCNGLSIAFYWYMFTSGAMDGGGGF